jgi:hypothetical protein
MADEIKMPTRLAAIKGAARRLMLGQGDLDMLMAAGVSIAMFAYAVGVLLTRMLLFAAFPLSLVLLYPLIRATPRRWYRHLKSEEARRAELVAELERTSDEPIEWPHDWAKPIPSADLYRAAREQEELEQADPDSKEQKS